MEVIKRILIGTVLFPAYILLQSCNDAPKGDDAVIAEKQHAAKAAGEIFTAGTANSNIRFTGHGVGKNHSGNFKLSAGSVAVSGN
ncbi:MAG: hypothetical protein C4308_13760 [Chitinophagaceae bacterium]